MKKLLLVVGLLFVVLAAGFTDEYVISTIDCYRTDYFFEKELVFKYDDENDLYYLYSSNSYSACWFILTPEDLEILRANVGKALDWIQIAKDNNTSVTKELPDSKMYIKAIMRRGDDWYNSRREITLTFTFLSKIEPNEVLCSLLIDGTEVPTVQNQYIDIEFEDVVFVDDLIDFFYNAISEETIEKAKKQHEKQKEVDALFT